MGAIRLSDVRKTYAGGIEAVKGVSLEIGDGEMVVLVGPSGCGKSTLLRMVAGLERLTAGSIEIAGRVVDKLEPAERDIAMVFQNYALYPHMTVRRNLAYGLENRRVPADEIARRVEAASRILDIAPYLDRKPRHLSGGQRQRVAMGRAIVRNPAAFLFDEPLSNLDAKLRVHMRAEIRRLQRDLRVTSLYVTHDQLEAMTLADRLVVLNAGRIEQVGTPIELYERPDSVFVAGFIGSPPMNLIPVRILDGELAAVEGAGLSGRVSAPPDVPLVLGIRPEDLVMAGARDPSALSLSLIVSVVEPVGAESYVHGTLSGSATSIAIRVPGRCRIQPGAVVMAVAPPSAIHLFDAASERRIEA
jgi:sn-glycerol 3-phosphate transport system ATP-binding protein